MTCNEDLTAVRSKQAGNHGDGGGFARAVRAKETVDLTLFDMERDAIHCLELSERFREIPKFEHERNPELPELVRAVEQHFVTMRRCPRFDDPLSTSQRKGSLVGPHRSLVM